MRRPISEFSLLLVLGVLPAACGNATVDFDALDTSGDGYLDRAEISNWFDEAGVFARWDEDQDSRLTAFELDRGVFELWDLDDDERVSFAEWDVAVDDWFPSDLSYGSFQDWDLDGDSVLTLDEIYEDLERTGWNRRFMGEDRELTPKEFVDGYFLLWDANRDGLIDRAEFRRAWEALAFP